MAEQREQVTDTTTREPRARRINGIDTGQLRDTIDAIGADASKGSSRWSATTRWKHGAVSECHISGFELGGQRIPQDYTIAIDEPSALLGSDTAPNPQMVLLAAINACVLNTFIVNASVQGISVQSVEMHLEGELDLRGFLGIDPNVNPGYDELTIVCRVKADGTREQLQSCLDAGTRYSPNFQSISRPVDVKYRLEVG